MGTPMANEQKHGADFCAERERGAGGGGERETGHVMRTKMERVTSHSFTWVATGGG
jgi:hypothetical protein